AACAAGSLVRARGGRTGWLVVGPVAAMEAGSSRPFRAPDGSTIVVTRRGGRPLAEDFIALSSTCPHLGCQVRWEEANRRDFCPCHNRALDPDGRAIARPPFDPGPSLSPYPLQAENGLLYSEVPLERIA